MKTVRLALLELRRFRGPLLRLVPLGVALVPLVSAAVYLWSAWDPYGRTDRIPVAVVNQDRPVTSRGELVNAGQLLVEQLRQDPIFDWRFVGEGPARRGLRDGRYAFTITVPADFSARLASPASQAPQRASMLITLDDANGYLTGKLAETTLARLQDQVDAAARTAYAQRILGDLDTLRGRLAKASTTATSQRDGIARLAQDAGKLAQQQRAAGQLATTGQQLTSSAQHLSQSLSGAASSMADQIPAATQAVVDASGSAQRSSGQAAAGITTAQQQADLALAGLTALAQDHPDLRGDANFQLAIEAARQADRAAATAGVAAQEASTSTQLADGLGASLDQIPPSNAQQRAQIADSLSAPVDVRTTNLHPARSYGRGLAPLLCGIGLWVFGLVAYLVLRPLNPRALAGRAPALTVAVAGWLPAAGIGVAGALALYGVLAGGLGLHPLHPLWTIGLLVLTAGAFVALIHLLRTLFGIAGVALSVVLLTFQLTASGGLYPLETAPAPFRTIHPLSPLTYVVDGLRVTISGGEPFQLIRAAIVLGALLLVCLGLTALVVARRRVWTVGRLTLRPAVEL